MGGDRRVVAATAGFTVLLLDLPCERLAQHRLQLAGQFTLQAANVNGAEIDFKQINAVDAVGRAQLRATLLDDGLQMLTLDSTKFRLNATRRVLVWRVHFKDLAPDSMTLCGHRHYLLPFPDPITDPALAGLTVAVSDTVRVTGIPVAPGWRTRTKKVVSWVSGDVAKARSAPVPS